MSLGVDLIKLLLIHTKGVNGCFLELYQCINLLYYIYLNCKKVEEIVVIKQLAIGVFGLWLLSQGGVALGETIPAFEFFPLVDGYS